MSLAGGKLEGEYWEVHFGQKGPAKFTTLVRGICLRMLDLTMKQDCLDTEQNSNTQQAPDGLPVY